MITIRLFSWLVCDHIFYCVTKKLKIKANLSQKKMDKRKVTLLIAIELKKAII